MSNPAQALYEALENKPNFAKNKRDKYFLRDAGEKNFTLPPKGFITYTGPIALVGDGKHVLQLRGAANVDFNAELNLDKYALGVYAVDSALTGSQGVTREQLQEAGSDPLTVYFLKGVCHQALFNRSLQAQAVTVHAAADKLYNALTSKPCFSRQHKFFQKPAGEKQFIRPPQKAATHNGPIALVDRGRTVLHLMNVRVGVNFDTAGLDLDKYDLGVYEVDSALNGSHGVTLQQLRAAGSSNPLKISFNKDGKFAGAAFPTSGVQTTATATVHPAADKLYAALENKPNFAKNKSGKYFLRDAGEKEFTCLPKETATHKGPIALVDGGRTVLQLRGVPNVTFDNFATADLDLDKYALGVYAVDSALTKGAKGVTLEQLQRPGSDPLTLSFTKAGVLGSAYFPRARVQEAVHPAADKLYRALVSGPDFSQRYRFFLRPAGETRFNTFFDTKRSKCKGPIAFVDEGNTVLHLINAPASVNFDTAGLNLGEYDLGAYTLGSGLTGGRGVTPQQLREAEARGDPLTMRFSKAVFDKASLPKSQGQRSESRSGIEGTLQPDSIEHEPGSPNQYAPLATMAGSSSAMGSSSGVARPRRAAVSDLHGTSLSDAWTYNNGLFTHSAAGYIHVETALIAAGNDATFVRSTLADLVGGAVRDEANHGFRMTDSQGCILDHLGYSDANTAYPLFVLDATLNQLVAQSRPEGRVLTGMGPSSVPIPRTFLDKDPYTALPHTALPQEKRPSSVSSLRRFLGKYKKLKSRNSATDTGESPALESSTGLTAGVSRLATGDLVPRADLPDDLAPGHSRSASNAQQDLYDHLEMYAGGGTGTPWAELSIAALLTNPDPSIQANIWEVTQTLKNSRLVDPNYDKHQKYYEILMGVYDRYVRPHLPAAASTSLAQPYSPRSQSPALESRLYADTRDVTGHRAAPNGNWARRYRPTEDMMPLGYRDLNYSLLPRDHHGPYTNVVVGEDGRFRYNPEQDLQDILASASAYSYQSPHTSSRYHEASR